MIITDTFIEYMPEDALPGFKYCKCNQGDWYALQEQFSDNTLKLLIDKNDRIVSASIDVSAFSPEGFYIVEIKAAYASDLIGHYYIEGQITQYKTLEEAKIIKLKQLNAATDKAMNAITGLYPKIEVNSWPQQQFEALQVVNESGMATPMLAEIAQERGINIEVLANKVLEKSTEYSTLSGKNFGCRQKVEQQIETAISFEELDVIPFPQ